MAKEPLSQQVFDKMSSALDSISQKLGVAVADLWATFIWQAYIEGIVSVAQSLLMLGAVGPLAFNALIQWRHAFPQNAVTDTYYNLGLTHVVWDGWRIAFAAALAATAVILLWQAIAEIGEAVQKIVNPKYAAFSDLTWQIRRLK